MAKGQKKTIKEEIKKILAEYTLTETGLGLSGNIGELEEIATRIFRLFKDKQTKWLKENYEKKKTIKENKLSSGLTYEEALKLAEQIKSKDWDFQCVTDASNWGDVWIQKGKILNRRNGLVFLEDGTITTLKEIKNLFDNPELDIGLWSEYNPTLKKWRRIGNIKWLKNN